MTDHAKPAPTKKRAAQKRAETMLETRRALIAAGLELFAETGLDAPSLDVICERAGFTRGAFYVHFKDREDFVVSAMESLIDDYLANVFPQTHGGPLDLARTIQGFATSAANGVSPLGPNTSIRLHHLLDACSRTPRIREHFDSVMRRIVERVAEAIEGARESGLVRTDVSPKQLARLLVTLALGIQAGFDSGTKMPVHEYAETMFSLMRPQG